MKNNYKNRNRGITLIALVITIIVLLILAGIAIVQLSNNGLFNRIKIAKEIYTNSQAQEELEITKMTNSIDEHVGGNRGNITLTDEEYAQFKALVAKNNGNYSTDEQIVGTWIDGKPIYRRVFNNLNIAVQANKYNSTLNISNMNIDIVMPGTCGYSTSHGNFRVSYWDNKSTSGKLSCWPIHDGTINIIILEYTKTTD